MTTDVCDHWCDFCGKPSEKVEFMIAGPTVHICSPCVESAMTVISAKRAAVARSTPKTAPEENEQWEREV